MPPIDVCYRTNIVFFDANVSATAALIRIASVSTAVISELQEFADLRFEGGAGRCCIGRIERDNEGAAVGLFLVIGRTRHEAALIDDHCVVSINGHKVMPDAIFP